MFRLFPRAGTMVGVARESGRGGEGRTGRSHR